MSIYIEGMETPKDRPQLLWIYPNGKALTVQSDVDPWKDLQAVPVPEPHGRLIDEREINSRFDNGIKTISELPFPNDFVELYKQLAAEVKEEIGKCHTIIPASEEE